MKTYISLPLLINLVLTSCNVENDIHQKTNGRGDDYSQRKSFIECVERRMAVSPLPKLQDYDDVCWPVYALECSI